MSEKFRKYLIGTLVNHDAVPSVYNDIVNKLFVDYRKLPLVDVYNVFQAFADNWAVVDSDLARLETEDWNICSETEPNMVTKKDPKTKKTVEEQKGWKGKIIPFDLVKAVFYTADFDEMSRLATAADSKASEYAGIWENMDDEAKSVVCKDDDEAAFDTKKFKAAIKSGDLDADAVESINAIQRAIAEEKALRKRSRKSLPSLRTKQRKRWNHCPKTKSTTCSKENGSHRSSQRSIVLAKGSQCNL